MNIYKLLTDKRVLYQSKQRWLKDQTNYWTCRQTRLWMINNKLTLVVCPLRRQLKNFPESWRQKFVIYFEGVFCVKKQWSTFNLHDVWMHSIQPPTKIFYYYYLFRKRWKNRQMIHEIRIVYIKSQFYSSIKTDDSANFLYFSSLVGEFGCLRL